MRVPQAFAEVFPEGSPSSTEVVLNVLRTAELLLARVAAAIQPFGLSPAGFSLLDVLANAGDALKLPTDRRTFNSINGMSPGNPAIEAVRAMPVAPGVHAHSIIPTLQDGPLEARNDGVVEYRSAHIDGVESELVIEHQGHSTQSNPLAVREVRRILIEELGRPEPAGGETRQANASALHQGH